MLLAKARSLITSVFIVRLYFRMVWLNCMSRSHVLPVMITKTRGRNKGISHKHIPLGLGCNNIYCRIVVGFRELLIYHSRPRNKKNVGGSTARCTWKKWGKWQKCLNDRSHISIATFVQFFFLIQKLTSTNNASVGECFFFNTKLTNACTICAGKFLN